MPELQTERLQIVTLTPVLLRLALQDRIALARALDDIKVPSEWPGPDFGEIIPFVIKHLEEQPDQVEWNANLIIHRADQVIIGDAGFRDGPDETGTIEIGYSIIPGYRRQGYAFEATQALVQWAFTQDEVKRIVAECVSDNPGSIRILEKLGMQQVSQVKNILRWELTR